MSYSKELAATRSFELDRYPSDYSASISPEKAKKKLKKIRKKIAKLQDKMYAHDRYGVLI